MTTTEGIMCLDEGEGDEKDWDRALRITMKKHCKIFCLLESSKKVRMKKGRNRSLWM